MKLKTLLTLTLLFSYTTLYSQEVFTTVSGGLWNVESNWENGLVPAYENAAEIHISHGMVISDSLTITQGGTVEISTTGGICGHFVMTLINASMVSEGFINLDKLVVSSSDVDLINGAVILTLQGQINSSELGGPSSLTNSGASLSVGPWFDCVHDVFLSDNSLENAEPTLSIFPNPSVSEMHLKLNNISTDTEFRLINSTGHTVKEFTLEKGKTNFKVDVSNLSSGVYFARLASEDFTFTQTVYID